MGEITTTGNKGKGVRSDCFVSLELKDSGGIRLQVESKVAVMYGEDIRKQALEILSFFGITDA